MPTAKRVIRSRKSPTEENEKIEDVAIKTQTENNIIDLYQDDNICEETTEVVEEPKIVEEQEIKVEEVIIPKPKQEHKPKIFTPKEWCGLFPNIRVSLSQRNVITKELSNNNFEVIYNLNRPNMFLYGITNNNSIDTFLNNLKTNNKGAYIAFFGNMTTPIDKWYSKPLYDKIYDFAHILGEDSLKNILTQQKYLHYSQLKDYVVFK